MDTHIAKIYGACNPDSPAKEEFYIDCSRARGNSIFVEQIKDHIVLANASMDDFSDSEDFKCFLFTGHSGCGKSSELKKLVRKLGQYSEDSRFYPIFIDANEYLDKFDVTITDILLAIATETSNILQKDEKIQLDGKFFAGVTEKLKSIFTDWEVEKMSVELPYGLPKFDIKRLAKDESAREKVRRVLKDDTYLLLQEINKLLTAAREVITNLESHGTSRNYQDIVIVLDNLEKIEKFDKGETGLDSARRLFLNYSNQLNSIKSHIIYTVPIDLMRSSHASVLGTLYDKSFVLPMVKVFKRDGVTEFSVGVDLMKKLLAKRLGELKLEEAFEDAAVDLLIKFSGGHIRTLLTFARESCTDAENLPISAANVNHAINSEYQNISPNFFPSYTWDVLAKLDLSSNKDVGVEPERCVEVLEKLLLFEYINGDDESVKDVNNRNQQIPWYAVNPIYRELDQFKRAKEKLLQESEKEQES